jgi:STE24 endopeptidase
MTVKILFLVFEFPRLHMQETSKQTPLESPQWTNMMKKGRFLTGQAKRYSKLKTRLVIIQLFLTAAFLIIMLFSGASLLLKGLVAGWCRNFYLQVGLYLAVFAGIYYLLFVGLEFYGGFLLEHKFLLSNQTVLGWLKNNVKKGLLSLLMLLIVGEAFYLFLRHFPNHWWLLMAGAWVLFTIILSKIMPVLIIPMFYKCSPLTNGGLKERLLRLCKDCGVEAEQVFEVQLSKDTRKANAAVAGMGKGRRILLGDTLLKNYSGEEIEAIFAHELGHVRMLHVWKILGFSTAIALVSFYLTHLLLETGMTALGFDGISDIAGFPFLAMVLMVAGLVFMPIQNAYLRHLEKQADIFATKHIENWQSFASAITKLGTQNLSDPLPSRWEELLLYDHPPISKRLRYMRGKGEEYREYAEAGEDAD